MARGHWLDPLARRLLLATGQIQAAAPRSAAGAPTAAATEQDRIERELLALRLAQQPGLQLRTAEEVRHAAALGWRLDVNRATAADWRRLPGCSEAHIDLLLRLQAGGVQLSGREDLRQLLEVDAELVQSWEPLLEFRWYGEPPAPLPPRPVPVNQAGSRALRDGLELSPERIQRLLRERARGPFRDLADLQQRLQLPPSLVEGWIGRVSFEQGPAGPLLPPQRPPSQRPPSR